MIEMKISPTDDCTWFNEDYTLMIDGDTPKEAEVAAGKINNHDRMVEEIAELNEFVKKVSELGIETFHFETQGGDEDCFEYVHTDIVDDAIELLTKLNQEWEE